MSYNIIGTSVLGDVRAELVGWAEGHQGELSAVNEIERQIMDFLLRGEHPVLALLRKQVAVATVSKREFTGVGFFTYFQVPSSAPRLPDLCRLDISDVHADVSGLQHGAGFVLFVENGVLNDLECFIYEEAWPTDAKLLRVYYMRPNEPGGSSLVETQERDIEWAIREKRR